MTENAKANRIEACSFLQIEQKLNKVFRLLHFAEYVACDFPAQEGLSEKGYDHQVDNRRYLLSDTLTDACSILTDAVEAYDELVRVSTVRMGVPVTYRCKGCIDCQTPLRERLDTAPSPETALCSDCCLQSAKTHDHLRDSVNLSIRILSLRLNRAHELGCVGHWEPFGGIVRKRLHWWGELGYYPYPKCTEPETETKDDE